MPHLQNSDQEDRSRWPRNALLSALSEMKNIPKRKRGSPYHLKKTYYSDRPIALHKWVPSSAYAEIGISEKAIQTKLPNLVSLLDRLQIPLQLSHAFNPALIIGGFVLEKLSCFRVWQDHEPLFPNCFHHVIPHLFR